MCDGLSKTLHDQLVQALDEQDRTKLTSAYTLCTRWIEARTEEELSRYRSIYALAMDICEEAFSRRVITPGVTTTTEVEEWIAQEINRLGLTFWFSPHVDIQRKGMPGVGTTGPIIQHGDLLHYDVGIQYFGLCTDSQRLGYVLRENETEVPQYLQEGLRRTNRFQDIVAEEHIAGRTGNEILKRSLDRAKSEGLLPMLYCHPVGFFGHSAGTVVGLWDQQEGTGAFGDFPLHHNTCYALELNTESFIAEWDNQKVRFNAEETVAFTKDGELTYLYPGRDRIYAISCCPAKASARTKFGLRMESSSTPLGDGALSGGESFVIFFFSLATNRALQYTDSIEKDLPIFKKGKAKRGGRHVAHGRLWNLHHHC